MAQTARNYIDDMRLMAQVDYATLELGLGTSLHFLNLARKAVFNTIANRNPQLFTLKKTGSNPITFADTDLFFRDNGAMVDPGGGNALVSCRKVDVLEEQTVKGNTFEIPASYDPIYTVKVKVVQITPTGGNAVIYYLKTPVDFTALTDTEDTILGSTYELVERRMLVSAYEKMNMTNALQAVQADFESQLDQYTKNADLASEAVRVALQSRVSYQTMGM